jgi:hypothetical protein
VEHCVFFFCKSQQRSYCTNKEKTKKATCPRLHHAGPSQTEAKHKPAIRMQAFVARDENGAEMDGTKWCHICFYIFMRKQK